MYFICTIIMYFICTIMKLFMFHLKVLLGVPNHCASDRAIQAHNISRTICIIIIIMSSALYGCRWWRAIIRSTLASFDVKQILFDFRNTRSACKYWGDHLLALVLYVIPKYCLEKKKKFHFKNMSLSKSYFKNCCERLWKRREKHENYNEAINAI